ncbi:MAG TPA: serine hydrolase domain-containing protein, partial [Gemmatimonadaceae bacterium]|nr:serine hydrolase domain-containing protein [Gemmatimonadaceae bacterium]
RRPPRAERAIDLGTSDNMSIFRLARLTAGVALAIAVAADSAAQDTPQVAIANRASEPARRGPTDARELESFLDGMMAAHLEDHHVAGAVVSVVRNGQLLFAKGYGLSDNDKRTPVDAARTLFRIGSVSKLFTWTAVMQLVEQGKLDLDTDVNRYIDFTIPASYPQPITLRHLLTHTPGFEDRGIGLFSGKQEPRSAWLPKNLPARVRPPGTFSAYSNYGTTLAGYIVERAAGMSWEEYVEKHILQPLGMTGTTAREPLPPPLKPNMSGGYQWDGNELDAKDFEIVGSSAPAGSVSSTGADMARFMIAHLQGGQLGDARILADSTARLMHSRAFTHDDRLNGFALGFYEKSSHGLRIIGHGGDTQWFHTDMALVPSESLGVFVSYNSAGGGELSFGPFLELFLDHYYPVQPLPRTAVSDSVAAEGYMGAYRVNRSSYTTLEKAFGLASVVTVGKDPESGSVVVKSPLGTQELVPTGPALFREIDGSGLVAFREGEGGQATHLFLGAAPMLAFERLAWYQSPALHLTLAGIAILLFLSVLIAVPVRWFLWRRFPELRSAAAPTRTPRRLAAAVALLNIAFLIGLAVILGDPVAFLLRGEIGALKVLLILPMLAALLTLGLLWFAVVVWRRRLWGRWARLHYTAVAVASLIFVIVLGYWNLLGWRT